MGTAVRYLIATLAAGATMAITAALARDEGDLAAPVYPGAVPAVLAGGVQAQPEFIGTFGGVAALDCSGDRDGDSPGPWCFLSRDSIDQVKAFYDRSIGTMRPLQGRNGEQGYVVFVERAWFPGSGEEQSPGFGYSRVSAHALPPPPVMSAGQAPAGLEDDTWEGQEAYQFYAQTRHFGGFLDGVDWFGDPTKREQADLDAVYAQYNRLESAFFQRKGPELAAADELLREQYSALRAQKQQAAAMAPAMGMMQRAAAPDNSAAPTAQEDAQFNQAMQQDPELMRRYTALTQQIAVLMSQGKFDEADALLEEIEALEQGDPQLAGLAGQQQGRQDSASARAQAEEDAILASSNQQMDEAVWGTAMDYIKAVDAEDYYTLIVIDNALTNYERDYSRDRAAIDADTAGWVEDADLGFWGLRY